MNVYLYMQALYDGIRHRESFSMKTLLGGIRKSLAQQIFPHLWYSYSNVHIHIIMCMYMGIRIPCLYVSYSM